MGIYTYRRFFMEIPYYEDYIMKTILWRPNFGDLILWKLYYRNLIMETKYIVET